MASATRPHRAAPAAPRRWDILSHHRRWGVHAEAAAIKPSTAGCLPCAETGRNSRTPRTGALSGVGGGTGTTPPATGGFAGRTAEVARRAAEVGTTVVTTARLSVRPHHRPTKQWSRRQQPSLVP